MKILLIGIGFGNYEYRIVKELRNQGHEVSYMRDTYSCFTVVSRILGMPVAETFNRFYLKKKIGELKEQFDRVIVIVGRKLSLYFLSSLKERNQQASFVLYLWDDKQRVENFDDTYKIYDEIYSFDLKDCKRFGFKHLPLFFTRGVKKKVNKEYDLYSAMFSHSDREKITLQVVKKLRELKRSYRIYISLGKYEYFRRYSIIKKNHDRNLQYLAKPISEEENYENMEKSNAILDIQFSSQIGLTMRTIESLGLMNKLITTNKSIRYYDFFCSKNVLLIDRTEPMIDDVFLSTPYVPIREDIYQKYSLTTWCKTLTGEIPLHNYLGEYRLADIPL